MKRFSILVVDDEPNIRFVLERTLSKEGYLVDMAADGAEAIKKSSNTSYDLILLDLQMKPIGGIEVLNTLRQRDPNIVMIILTAHSSIESAVEALRLGAFDYLLKPAESETIRECVARGLRRREEALHRVNLIRQIETLRQALRILETEANSLDEAEVPGRFFRSGKLIIDLHHRIATMDGKLMELTSTEFNLLSCLVQNAPRPVSARQIVNAALSYDSEETEAREIAKWHIHHLRQKIEPNPEKPRYIKTVRYQGYMWSGE